MDHFKACQDVYFLGQGHYMREFLLNLFSNMDSFEITKNINVDIVKKSLTLNKN